MQLSNGDPLAPFRATWRLKARNAKNTWTPGTEPIEAAMESTFLDGAKFAAEFLEGEGHPELAIRLRARIVRRA